jgi:hypothetical protein
MRFKVAEYGEVFSTRRRGAELLDVLEQEADSVTSVEIDFDGVRSVGYSFADEFMGELAERASRRDGSIEISLVNASDRVERVILGSLERRGVDRAVVVPA